MLHIFSINLIKLTVWKPKTTVNLGQKEYMSIWHVLVQCTVCNDVTQHFIELLSERNILYQLQLQATGFRFHDSQLPYCVSEGKKRTEQSNWNSDRCQWIWNLNALAKPGDFYSCFGLQVRSWRTEHCYIVKCSVITLSLHC
jgi:hypothetical protein